MSEGLRGGNLRTHKWQTNHWLKLSKAQSVADQVLCLERWAQGYFPHPLPTCACTCPAPYPPRCPLESRVPTPHLGPHCVPPSPCVHPPHLCSGVRGRSSSSRSKESRYGQSCTSSFPCSCSSACSLQGDESQQRGQCWLSPGGSPSPITGLQGPPSKW